ncbi:hypothetical protein B0H66DRAFT_599251 [Apodospora peruviana]|uniref:DUF6594 domain-containing protein n=1 Tax=Apodospora peruviana TaxID=516989 RepID=A0AAE0IHD6_9PEZI|nr:hypothetical protein B0H66DRAFT_599251 [Apodospora peruviana]
MKHHDGYAKVAQWMAQDADNETLVFRKFDELAVHNLLYLQSELLELEERLCEMNKVVSNGVDMDLKGAAREWEVLQAHVAGDTTRAEVAEAAKKRMTLVHEIRTKLREYHEALLLQSQIANICRPDRRVLDAMRTCLFRPTPFKYLGGKASRFLESEKDLVALKSSPDSDYLSRFLRRYWVQSRELAPDMHGGQIARFEESAIAKTANIVTVLVAAIFLIGSILAFHYARGDALKLSMIAAFTIGFSASIGLITNARRAEVFAATAAYAAVLVVFVSSDLAGNSTQSPQP